jgi:hypothetical protein
MTKGEALAVVLRIYLGKKLSETTSPWFKNYLQKGKDL